MSDAIMANYFAPSDVDGDIHRPTLQTGTEYTGTWAVYDLLFYKDNNY